MSARVLDHRKRNADRQQQDIQKRIRAALAELKAEFESQGSGEIGSPRERVSLAIVLRRAGRIDKNTLNRPYHQSLRREVDAFLAQYKIKRKPVTPKDRPLTHSMEIDRYAQMLAAAYLARDETQKKLEAAFTEIELKNELIASLNRELDTLRKSNVLFLSEVSCGQTES